MIAAFSLLTAMHLFAPPEPVIMTERQIGPASEISGGTTSEITVGEHKATLFIPVDFKPDGKPELWVHFHTAAWFIVQEFQRAKFNVPVLTFNLGQGSTTYAKPFLAKGGLEPFLSAASKELGAEVGLLHFTSFSAGYGAVRLLVQEPEVLGRLKTVILADSMYASLQEGAAERTVTKEHVACWMPLAEKAMKGDCTWIITTSQITPDSYAGTWEVAKALVAGVGGVMTEVGKEDCAAAGIEGQRLLRRFEKGRLWVWSYAGEDAMAHMTHPRHLAELIEVSQKLDLTNRS